MVPLKAALNGSRSQSEHPALPIAPESVARDARAVQALGAFAVHVHPRDARGRESLDPDVIAATVTAIRRAAPGIPVGVSTGEWIHPKIDHALAAIQSWRVLPDFASVNFSEPGAFEICRALRSAGVGVELGLSSVSDLERFLSAPVPLVRILLEPGEPDPAGALANAEEMLRGLDAAPLSAERLLHGQGPAAWPVLTFARSRGLASRVGLEDVLHLPDGRPAPDNAALFSAAVGLS